MGIHITVPYACVQVYDACMCTCACVHMHLRGCISMQASGNFNKRTIKGALVKFDRCDAKFEVIKSYRPPPFRNAVELTVQSEESTLRTSFCCSPCVVKFFGEQFLQLAGFLRDFKQLVLSVCTTDRSDGHKCKQRVVPVSFSVTSRLL